MLKLFFILENYFLRLTDNLTINSNGGYIDSSTDFTTPRREMIYLVGLTPV